MKSLNEILIKKNIEKGNLKAFGNSCREDLIANGYVYNICFGWEKIEIIESFGLNANMPGVPFVKDFEVDCKERVVNEKDEFGNKTGNKEVKRIWYKTNKVIWRPNDNWLAYMQFKKDRWAKYDAEEYARKINTPPPADEYYNN